MRSLVLGEAQILGQVRTALEQALASGTAGPELRRMFESAIAAARRVRAETALGRGVASVPQASVEFACRRLGTVMRSTALLIGAGNMGELAAKQLVKRRVGELLVLGRDQARASRLAERYGGRAISSENLSEALARSDVIISSTGAPRPILDRGELERALARRSDGASRPLLLIDLAVPRDVDPAVSALAGVELHTIDDLKRVVQGAFADRRAELPAAYSILRHEVARFTRWLDVREAMAA
jgi:glutamyl-tRNA reductase